jgi:hypothetical protein
MPGASWSPVSRYALTRAIVETGSFEITPYAAGTGDRARVDGRFYSDKAPVPSLLALPGYALFHSVAKMRGRLPAFRAEGTEERPARHVVVSPAFANGLYVCSLSTAGLSGALLGVVLLYVLRRRVDEWSACLGAAATVIATPLLPYAASFFGHAVGAAAVLGAAALLDPLGGPPTRRRVLLAGALLGLAMGTEYVLGVVFIVTALWLAIVAPARDRARSLGLLVAGAVPPLLVVAGYHTACFGAPWRTGYGFIVHPAFAAGQSSGFFGIGAPRLDVAAKLLFGSARGLFYLSPLCLLAVIAGILAWRRSRDPLLVLVAATFLALLIANAGYFQWDGGWATGPRHLVPALGLLGVCVGQAFAQMRLRTLAAVAGGVSATVLLLTTAVGLEAPPDQDAITGYLLPSVRQGLVARISGASNLGLVAGLSRGVSVVPLFVWVVLGLGVLRALSDDAAESATGGARTPV